ncbi:hypothetical protein CgunFtcFv8_020837 [Champsocephalus gunnari]|uniref:Uncharacterized protein n=2 Tax=Champsocephalus TaxID=52236 RepID=A0AAN8EAH5_CHAGU|nr:hypothetical protein CgunFtcFv8_020837 [Champsocephalus gunnari]
MQMSEAERQLSSAGRHSNSAGSRPAGSGLPEERVPAAETRDRLTGRGTEPEWALLPGFFASPSLNESNP